MPDPNALPIYQRTAERLIREIAAGRLLDGERLPPERDMAVSLGISVGTLRKSLADLQSRGLLERRQGSGNYIRHQPEASGVYAFFRLELAKGGGGLPTAEVLSVARLEKPRPAPGFGPSPEAHRIRRLRAVGGVPAALEEIWLDGARAERIAPRDLSESLYLFYRDRLGLVISRVEDRLGTAPVPDWTEAPFGPTAGQTVGYVERTGWDQEGRAVEFSRTWFDPDRVRYVARMR
ncbi:MAG: GntR family transcriptional regulator [Paracoccaceae bacterium]|nr:GntR family transcriptional regulator [Paracoccaceae bacterium]